MNICVLGIFLPNSRNKEFANKRGSKNKAIRSEDSPNKSDEIQIKIG